MGFADIQIMKPSFEENLDKSIYADNPIGYVEETSLQKAQGIIHDFSVNSAELEANCKPKLIICADTIIIDLSLIHI